MKILKILAQIILTAIIVIASFYIGIYIYLISFELNNIITILACLVFPAIFLPLLLSKNKKKAFKYSMIYMLIVLILVGINYGIIKYEESITIDTSVNINVYEYLPFNDVSKIVKLDKEASLKLKDDLPIVDGAAAVFPVYSAFVNAVYPNDVRINDDVFKYSNTVDGYRKLARKEIDIFFGAYPSEEQIMYAENECGTEFEYNEIGKEGFVFFVNKNNPINSLTTEQIKGIYSGKITNWKDVGGKDEKIQAFQRNEGSGSQSMLIRFMGDSEIANPIREEKEDLMVGIIKKVADYKNYSNSIGFSFRYYLEGIIKNPNVKMLSVDGVEPTPENISNGSYPITTSLYAVTYKGNDNENVEKLINWVKSEGGQEIIEKTGYAAIK